MKEKTRKAQIDEKKNGITNGHVKNNRHALNDDCDNIPKRPGIRDQVSRFHLPHVYFFSISSNFVQNQ